MIKTLRNNPRRVFLIDGLGALLTIFLLIIMQAYFSEVIGMPAKAISLLTLIALIYAIYSFICHFFVGLRWQPYLRGIAIANLTYCCFTITLIIVFFQRLTSLGIIYFLIESGVIISIAIFELMIASDKKVTTLEP